MTVHVGDDSDMADLRAMGTLQQHELAASSVVPPCAQGCRIHMYGVVVGRYLEPWSPIVRRMEIIAKHRVKLFLEKHDPMTTNGYAQSGVPQESPYRHDLSPKLSGQKPQRGEHSFQTLA